MADTPQFIMERVFDAPRDLVWEAWTKPEYLSEWFGPGVDTIIHAFDLSRGGVWLNEMKGENYSMRSRIVFQTVDPPSKLVWHNSSANEDWEVTGNPNMPDWPTTMQMQVELIDQGDKTAMTMTWEPFNPSAAEAAAFAAAMDKLGKGWGAGMAILERLLERLQAG